jgi:hypothetical protein
MRWHFNPFSHDRRPPFGYRQKGTAHASITITICP